MMEARQILGCLRPAAVVVPTDGRLLPGRLGIDSLYRAHLYRTGIGLFVDRFKCGRLNKALHVRCQLFRCELCRDVERG